MTAPRLPNAGVRFPPPLWYLGAVLAGWLVNRWRAWPLTAGPSPLRIALGIAGVVAWLAIFLAALTAFRRANTTLVPNQPATAVVTTGPYRFTRNPMYVSLVALQLGLACFVNTWWAIVLLPVVVLTVTYTVIRREEAYLSEAFPDTYRTYASRVRRWL